MSFPNYPPPGYSWTGGQPPHNYQPQYLPPPGTPLSQSRQSFSYEGGNNPTGFPLPPGPPATSSPYGSSNYYPPPSSASVQHNYHPRYLPPPENRYGQSLMPTSNYPSGRTSPSLSAPRPFQAQAAVFGEPGGFMPPRSSPSPRPPSLVYLGVSIPPPPPAEPYMGSPPGFDARRVVEAIRKAVKGFGTDEKALSEAIAPLDAFQMESVRRSYESTTGKDLIRTIEKETSSWYEYSLRAKALGPVGFDCWLLNRASFGAGTHEGILTEILCDRTNSEIIILKAAYAAIYRRDLSSIIRSELTNKTERLFNMVLAANRDETDYMDYAGVQADVQTLYAAGPGRQGTDEMAICSIIATRSQAHIRALARAYHQTYGVKLSTVIRNEFSGHMKSALEFVVKGAEEDGYGVYRDAVLIHESMEGTGTKDERLIYRVIRSHWNKPRFEAIKQCFMELYGRSLTAKVRSETSGDYRDFMCAVIV